MAQSNQEYEAVIANLLKELQTTESEYVILAAKNAALQSKLDRVREMVGRYFHAQHALRGEASFSTGGSDE